MMKFKIQNSKFKIIGSSFIVIVSCFLLIASTVHADTATDNALSYLRDKQNAAGQITGGSFSDASPWAAIAFGAYGVNIDSVKNPTTSLRDYLLNNHPTNSSSAIEWEKWILAITAGGFNPYNFGSVDYVATLKSAPYYNANQIGDVGGVNDDWFGVMALIAGKVDVLDGALNDGVAFIISNRNGDWGWGYAPGTDSDSNDTAAAIQALVAAKNYGVTNANLDNAINNAKAYLLSTQDASGGFLYDKMPWSTTPDSNSTAWALMALNVLGMKDTPEGVSAHSWLLSQQSAIDNGFTSLDWGTFTFVSNSTITSDVLVGLSGKGWVVKIFDPSSFNTAPSSSPTNTPTPTPPVTTSSSNATPTPTPAPSVTPVPSATPANDFSADNLLSDSSSLTSKPESTDINNGEDDESVLGTNVAVKGENNQDSRKLIITMFFLGLGFLFVFIYLARPFIIKKLNK